MPQCHAGESNQLARCTIGRKLLVSLLVEGMKETKRDRQIIDICVVDLVSSSV